MNLSRNYRGWIAAWIVAIVFTLTLLGVERRLAQSGNGFWQLVETSAQSLALTQSGILLEPDLNLSDTSRYSPNRLTSPQFSNRQDVNQQHVGASDLLRRPPEPAANAVLLEPLSADDFVSLPLTQGTSNVEQLMASMDAALETPLRTISAVTKIDGDRSTTFTRSANSQSTPGNAPSAEAIVRIPSPIQLFHELAGLRQYLVAMKSQARDTQFGSKTNNQGERFVGAANSGMSVADSTHWAAVEQWVEQSHSLINQLVSEFGLDDSRSRATLAKLSELSHPSNAIGEQFTDEYLATSVIRAGYAIQRRVAVWNAVSACLEEISTAGDCKPDNANRYISATTPPKPTAASREELAKAIAQVESLLASNHGIANDKKLSQKNSGEFGNRPNGTEVWKSGSTSGTYLAWRNYLLLDELNHWLKSSEFDARKGNQLTKEFRSRLNWSDLSDSQRTYLQHAAIQQLAASLSTWDQDPVDYRQLLASLEQVEISPQSRLVSTVSETVAMLGRSEKASQRALAQTIDNHYRNANLRITVSQRLIERFLPEDQFEVRPVQDTILGAYTMGDSEVHTKLSVRLRPDPTAWNIELGVNGDVVSNTRSEKGPAILHNTSIANVQTQRLIRIDPTGVNVSAAPAQVSSQDYLKGMNTDFDGLPIVRDFARWVVREQFNQKRGVAGRITRQKIASQADAELDRRLDDGLNKIQSDLQRRLLGPLQQLALNPTVVNMYTTEDRLTLRYRLAHATQLTAYTPRPRAPTGALASVQVHESAINNTIQQIGLSGRSWTLPELFGRIGELLGTKVAVPEDVPNDLSIRFADRNPIYIELQGGRLRIHLRIAEFKRQEGFHAKNFIVTSTYIPVTDGLGARLIRDPDKAVEIQGKHLAMGDRLAVRVVFSKVFVSQSEIPLIDQKWLHESRTEGLAVSQFDLRDGWLGLAVSTR